jgi:hypothetical protein
VALNEPPDVYDDVWEDPEWDEVFGGYNDGNDDGYEPDPDATEGYEPEAYEIAPYQPPPRPWYRAPQALRAIAAIGVAVVVLLISTVLLVFHPPRESEPVVAPGTPTTTPQTAIPSTVASPPPLPPPAPPSSEPSTQSGSTVPVIVQTRVEQTPTKPPEIGVTRTPITREPISVAPSQHAPHPHY